MALTATVIKKLWGLSGKLDQKRIEAQTPTPGITQITDIPYIDDGQKGHLLDVYYPEGTTSPLPVIIDIHGGGLLYGYKENNKNYCLYIASLGFTVININHRLAPDVFLPDQIRDVMAAMRWVAENGKKFPCDMENVFMTGDSAGGYLCAYCCLVNTSEQLQKLYNTQASGLNLNAIGLTSGAVYLKSGILKIGMLSPSMGKGYKNQPYFDYIDIDEVIDLGTLSPCYFVTSEDDFVKSSSVNLDKLLTQKGIEHQFHYWPKMENKKLPHVFSVTQPYWDESKTTIDEMTTFFRKYIKETQNI